MQRTVRSLAILSVLFLAACGGDDGDGNPTPDANANADADPNNTAPVASFTFTPDCTSSGQDPISFTSNSTDVDGDTLTCSWTFSSGTPGSSTDCSVTGVTFPNQAPYPVTLEVDDGNGGTNSTMELIAPCP